MREKKLTNLLLPRIDRLQFTYEESIHRNKKYVFPIDALSYYRMNTRAEQFSCLLIEKSRTYLDIFKTYTGLHMYK